MAGNYLQCIHLNVEILMLCFRAAADNEMAARFRSGWNLHQKLLNTLAARPRNKKASKRVRSGYNVHLMKPDSATTITKVSASVLNQRWLAKTTLRAPLIEKSGESASHHLLVKSIQNIPKKYFLKDFACFGLRRKSAFCDPWGGPISNELSCESLPKLTLNTFFYTTKYWGSHFQKCCQIVLSKFLE